MERPKLASYSAEIQDEIQNSDDSNNAPKTSEEVQKKLSKDNVQNKEADRNQQENNKLRAALGLPPLKTKSLAKNDSLEESKLASHSDKVQDKIQNSVDSKNALKTSEKPLKVTKDKSVNFKKNKIFTEEDKARIFYLEDLSKLEKRHIAKNEIEDLAKDIGKTTKQIQTFITNIRAGKHLS